MGKTALAALLVFAAALPGTQAAVVSGYLDDPGNGALVWSDLSAPLFGDDYDIANNVALHTLLVSMPDTYEFVSEGFTPGGADPFFISGAVSQPFGFPSLDHQCDVARHRPCSGAIPTPRLRPASTQSRDMQLGLSCQLSA